MRLVALSRNNQETYAVRSEAGPVPIAEINRISGSTWPESMETLIKDGRLDALRQWYDEEGRIWLENQPQLFSDQHYRPGPLFRNPGKIWGIGLNYVDHSHDLSEQAPTLAPASFMKPTTTIIGPGDEIRIPEMSEKTTAEAELGVVIGRRAKNVPREKWLDVVAGFTTIIDMTAEDILRKNPRYLTMSKSFDTFFSFGPELVTPDEVADVSALRVATVINGRVHAENIVAHMTFPPDELVSFHSRVMTLLPGDVISTGTPGAGAVRHGDEVSCRISGFSPLANPVVDLKQS